MRIVTQILLTLLVISVLMTGCGKKKEEPVPDPIPIGVDGTGTAGDSDGGTDTDEGDEDEDAHSDEGEETSDEETEPAESSVVEESSEEDPEAEASSEAPESAQESSQEEPGETINNMFRQATYDLDTGDAIGILYNDPDGGLLYGIRVSDEVNVTTSDRVLIIPKYEHTSIQIYTLKSVSDKDGKTTQKKDELVYEIPDSSLDTVLFTSVPRIEDAPAYMLIMKHDKTKATYKFRFYSPAAPEYELLKQGEN